MEGRHPRLQNRHSVRSEVACYPVKRWMMVCLLLSAAVLFAGKVFSQVARNVAPFLIQGQITQCPAPYFLISFQDQKGHPTVDTIRLDKQGRFYWKTTKITKPQQAQMRAKGIQISNLLVAPGYNLNLTGNGKDHSTLFESKRISGVGAQSNRFSFLFDSLLIARGPGVDWLSLNEQELPRYSNQLRKLKDSLADVVFNKPATDDKYFSFFGSMVRLDNLFSQLAMLVTHVTWNDYKYSKAVSFVKEHIDTKVLNDLFKEEYLISNAYTSFIGNEWLDYLVSLDYQQDSSLRHQRGYELKKINEAYKGKAREQALQRRITVSIELAKSLEVLNEQLAHIEKYGPTFTDQNKLEMLQAKYLGKKKELMQMQAGKPAPSFTLQGYDGRTYRLEDFRNKVIYLDLWASWCVPCRQEIPSLKLLHERYRNDDRIVFVSIAVLDRLDKWKAAIRTDKPTWIQLFDKDDLVAKSYFANAVPQFIIIDRNGNLVDFEAPWPSSGKKIIEVLDREIAK